MTHAELVTFAARWLNGTRNCAFVATEAMCFKSAESPDAIGWRPDGASILVECKVSREDFWADQRKPHRAEAGMGLERWYLTPEGLLRPDTIPSGWGLLEVRKGRVFRVVHALPRILIAGEIARIEQPLLVALTRRAVTEGAVRGVVVCAPEHQDAAWWGRICALATDRIAELEAENAALRSEVQP